MNFLLVCLLNLNGWCECVIFMIKSECLLKFLIFGKCYFDYFVVEFVVYYNMVWFYMECDYFLLFGEVFDEKVMIKLSEFEVKLYIGGLVKLFECWVVWIYFD